MTDSGKSLLLVIDLQKSFINVNTSLIPLKVEGLIRNNNFDYVAFTKFVNFDTCNFNTMLNYRGCMSEEERNIVIDTGDNKIFCKSIYSALNDELVNYINDNNIDIIYLCGIDTDACVLKTAIDLFENNYNFRVIENCSMSHSGKEFHEFAVKMLKKLVGEQNIISLECD